VGGALAGLAPRSLSGRSGALRPRCQSLRRLRRLAFGSRRSRIKYSRRLASRRIDSVAGVLAGGATGLAPLTPTPMQDFTKLDVWQKAHALTLAIYRNTAKAFPREELFGMRQQVRDAANSVESNIAEGCGRRTDGELLNFLGMSSGSLSELQCRLITSHDLGWLRGLPFDQLVTDIIIVRKMNWKLQKTLHR